MRLNAAKEKFAELKRQMVEHGLRLIKSEHGERRTDERRKGERRRVSGPRLVWEDPVVQQAMKDTADEPLPPAA